MSNKPISKGMRVSDDYEWADDETRIRLEELRLLGEEIERRRRLDMITTTALLLMFVTLTASLASVLLLLL